MLKRKEGQVKITIESDDCVNEIIFNLNPTTNYKKLYSDREIEFTIKCNGFVQEYKYRKGEEND